MRRLVLGIDEASASAGASAPPAPVPVPVPIGGVAPASRGRAAVTVDAERALAWYEHEAAIRLAPKQAEAVGRALRENFLVVTGGPGVGKTTVIHGIVAILAKKGLEVALAAPIRTRRQASVGGDGTPGFDAASPSRLASGRGWLWAHGGAPARGRSAGG